VLAQLLAGEDLPDPLLLAIPAGGAPVASAVAQQLGWPLSAAVVSKIVLPWNSEAGYGAVAWDGSVLLNRELLAHLNLGEAAVAAGIAATRQKVAGRVARLLGAAGLPELAGRSAILVDDGLASGFTLLAAVAALKRTAPFRTAVAVPTGHLDALRRVAAQVDLVCCANLRSGYPFAVAAAYRKWSDVGETEAARLLRGAD
jgi:predicted phosphoribosyltransferase